MSLGRIGRHRLALASAFAGAFAGAFASGAVFAARTSLAAFGDVRAGTPRLRRVNLRVRLAFASAGVFAARTSLAAFGDVRAGTPVFAG